MVPETWTHVLSCDHSVAQEQWRAALSTLVTALKDKNTPPQVVESMVSGLSQWFSHTAVRPLPPTIGALTRPQTLLTAAFQSQSDIGWSSLLRGHLSTHWGGSV